MSEEEKEIIRLQELIGRYIKHVVDCESDDFLDHYLWSLPKEDIAELRGYYEAQLERP